MKFRKQIQKYGLGVALFGAAASASAVDLTGVTATLTGAEGDVETVGGIVAGIVGVVVVFTIIFGLMRRA